jgi:lysozyme family protein
MKITFDEIIGTVLHHEGGYVNDPKDPGGETNYGVSKRAYPDVDIKNLTEDDAKDIYRRDYWQKYKCEELPKELRHIYFDMCINMGAGRAVKIMQETANAKGANLKIDGGMGPMTIGAMNGVELLRVRAYRVKYYATLIERKPDLAKFYFGWFKRSLEV